MLAHQGSQRAQWSRQRHSVTVYPWFEVVGEGVPRPTGGHRGHTWCRLRPFVRAGDLPARRVGVSAVLGRPVRLSWTGQPAAPGALRAECVDRPGGTGGRLAAALRAWPMLVFEITEDGTSGSDGERLAYVPGRGFHRRRSAPTATSWSARSGCCGAGPACAPRPTSPRSGRTARGAWDAELEPYRIGGDGAPITLLHQACG